MRIMIVGDFYSEQDIRLSQPFTGLPGQELTRMLTEAGIMQSDCYLTTVVRGRPLHGDLEHWLPAKKKNIQASFQPIHNRLAHPLLIEGLAILEQEINLVDPQVIVTLGNLPLFALMGADSALRWRGSLLSYKGTTLIPTLHPSTILQQWELRNAAVNDLRRAARPPVPAPEWNFRIRPSFSLAQETLLLLQKKAEQNELWLDLDIETKANHIACIGLSWTLLDALIIPLMCREDRNGYWTAEEEGELVYHLYTLLTHPNTRVRWQNGLFDAQYIFRYWHFIPRHGQDTMIAWHTMFAGQKKSLDYQASLLCDHYVQWKPEKGVWKTGA
jgi:DNA polymerase